MIDILYEDNHLLGICKPVNIPVQQDDSKDDDVLSLCKQYLKETYQKPGNVYLGLVHRLDRPVGGVLLLAKTSKAASRLSDTIRQKKMKKTYLAILDGIPPKQSDTLEDYLVKDSKTNMVHVTTADKGKFSRLNYTLLQTKGNHSLVKIDLETGRSHQIRVQFSSRHLPLLNDQRYHPHPSKGQIALWASELTFPHPTTKQEITLRAPYPKEAPWTEFEVNEYDND